MYFRISTSAWCIVLCSFLINSTNADEKADSPINLWIEAQKAAREGKSDLAVQLATQIITTKPEDPSVYHLRGREFFRLGKIKESIADLDRVAALNPLIEKQLWERGISHYYAKQFKKGAEQFALYQTYHDNDVENSAWRFLCMARSVGIEKARKLMLPIRNDRRIPMMEIYDLYRGRLKPADVLEAAQADKASPQALNRQLFYAHLYLGLYYEVLKKGKLAEKHIFAAEKHKIGHYMWDAAHVHADILRLQKKKNAKSKP